MDTTETGGIAMAFFNWEDRFSTNIQSIDQDHKKLMDLVNHLYVSVFECQDIEEERTLTGKILSELLEYTNYHFSTEEALMEKYNYPEYQEHKISHAWFVGEVNRLLREHEAGAMALSFPTFSFLKDWISNHILGMDKKYEPFLKHIGVE